MASHSNTKKESHTRIIQAALDCFSHKGYNQTTMDDIAAASGLSKGSLYWHFKNKEDLLESAIRELFIEHLGEEPLYQLSNLATASEKLLVLAQTAVDMSSQVSGMFNLFVEYWGSSSQRAQDEQVWMELILQYKDILVKVIEEGINTGEFHQTDAEALAWGILATYDGLAAYIMFKPDIDIPQISITFVNTLLHGLETKT
jgi:AcrR family transcriptional regulator